MEWRKALLLLMQTLLSKTHSHTLFSECQYSQGWFKNKHKLFIRTQIFLFFLFPPPMQLILRTISSSQIKRCKPFSSNVSSFWEGDSDRISTTATPNGCSSGGAHSQWGGGILQGYWFKSRLKVWLLFCSWKGITLFASRSMKSPQL